MAFTHVLVPTDFSEPAQHALRYAIDEATLHHARVTLLHVMPPRTETDVYFVTGAPAASGYQAGLDPDAGGRVGAYASSQPMVVRQDHNEAALTRLRDLIPAAFHDTWQVEIAAGHPADAIVRVAEKRNADLIVMGTHGRTGMQHVLLGSVAEKVVRLASCPVLTVRYKGDAREA
jgi:nucleotide-binding universal stress UspA family protein